MKYLNKRWLKRKGCRNVALVDIVRRDDEGKKFIETVITPYHIGRQFSYTSKPDRKGAVLQLQNVVVSRKGISVISKH